MYATVRNLLWTIVLAAILPNPAVSQEPQDEPASTSLSLLHDIVEPSAVPWWPPAPGWYLIGGVFLVVLLVWLVSWRRRAISNRYREAALSELEVMRANPGAARTLPALLKRVALVAWPRTKVARQTGGQWWQFVDDDGGGSFADRDGKTLDSLSYGRDEEMPSNEDVELAAAAVDGWIRHHHGSRAR